MAKKFAFSISGPKPAGLSIHRDQSGVPHIEAEDFEAAIWGSGYAHAVDRGTQLMMMRIVGQGRLCELLSDNEESLQTDRFFRRANWHNNIDQEVQKLDQRSRELCQAYCNGINAGLASKKLYAMKLLGYQPEPWTIHDTVLISRMASYLTLAQSQVEVERLFIELVQAGVATDKLAELFPIDIDSLDRDLIESIQLQEKLVPNEVIWNKALPRMMASNNWVVSGDKTASGKAIMANDPHLEVNRLPNVWCEQSLKWGNRSIIGMGMPGLAGVTVGRTRDFAWGATYTFMDTVDSWVQDCRAGKYRRGQDWHDFARRQELIKRKHHADETMVFYENDHGVLEGDPQQAGRYLTTKWVAAESGANSLMASLKLAETESIEQLMTNLGLVESSWNWVISDSKGNIAYQMSGLMPKRHASWNGFTPAPGWDSTYDWQGTVVLEDLPRCVNPEEGYIVTANQDLNHLGNVNPINMPMGDYRAKRIEALLGEHNDHDVSSMRSIQFDVQSNQAALFLDILLPLLEAKGSRSEVFHILNNWDQAYDLDSTGAPLFELFYSALRTEVFGHAGLGKEVVRHLVEQTGIFIDFYQQFDHAMLNEDSVWYDNRTRDHAFLAAFESVQSGYQQATWKDVNTVAFNNILFQGKLPAFLGFDAGPIPLLGGRATPHQGQIYSSNGRQTSFSPSVRLIADMGESVLHTCLAGGPSDNRFSRWYKSDLECWRAGDYKILSP